MTTYRNMRPKLLLLPTIVIFFLFSGCQSEDQIIEPELNILGHWKYQYELLNDGTKRYDNPYALLEFEYSDAFILKEDKSGNSIWFDTINGDFEWSNNNLELVITVTREDQSVDRFEYQISNLEEGSMEFESPNGSKYFMVKQ